MNSPVEKKERAAEIEERAARWIVLARQQEAAHDAAQLEAWLDADPRHRAAYLRLEAVWRRTGRLKALRALDGTIDKDLLKSSTRNERWQWMAAAASVVLTVAGWMAWTSLDGTRWQTHATEPGGFARVTLKDGSTVDLNSASEIRVRFTDSGRDVMLVRGEGHFGVTRDARRPFVVEAGGQSIRAVGTAFTVRLRAARQVDVLVTEGRVAVGTAEPIVSDIRATKNMEQRERAVSAGEAAALSDESVVVRRVEADEVSRRLAWAAGRLYFAGDTLADAVAQFNRYTARKLQIEDDELAQLKIGGNFRATDVDGFVSALRDSFGVQTLTQDDGTLRLVHPQK